MDVVTGSKLTVADLRGALRLANELHELSSTDPTARRRHLLAGLCALVGADVGVAVARAVGPGFRFVNGPTPDNTRGRRGGSVVVSHGWDRPPATERTGKNGAQRTGHGDRAERHFAIDPEPHPLVGPMLRLASRRPGQLVTCLRADVVDDASWRRSPGATRLRHELAVDECVVSVYPTAGGHHAAWMFLYRAAGAGGTPSPGGPFTERHRELLHAVHSEMDWLYDRLPTRNVPPTANANGATEDAPPGRSSLVLTTRQRQTLDHLLAGASEKQAAANMGLSPHTVHIHIKSLYRAFKVNTRQELLALFIGQGRS